MRHLTRSIITLVLGLAVFYNLERLDINNPNVINIDSFVYIIGLVATISVILVPLFRRFNVAMSIGFWLGLYLLIKLSGFAVITARPLFGGIYTYLSITEMALLVILVWMSHQLVLGLQEFKDAVRRVTFFDTEQRVRKFYEADDEIQVEMFRSRQHHHPLSIIVVEPTPESIQSTLHRLVQDVQQSMLNGYVINSMAQMLSKYLRRTDLILEHQEHGRCIVVCPETTAADLQVLVEYIQSMVEEQLGTSIRYGLATFPDEALTFEELVHQAESQLKHKSNNGYVKTRVTV